MTNQNDSTAYKPWQVVQTMLEVRTLDGLYNATETRTLADSVLIDSFETWHDAHVYIMAMGLAGKGYAVRYAGVN